MRNSVEKNNQGLPSVLTSNGYTAITSFNQLCHASKLEVERVLNEVGLSRSLEVGTFDNLQVPRLIQKDGETIDMEELLEAIVEADSRKSKKSNAKRNYPDEIDFEEVNIQTTQLAEFIKRNSEELIAVLTQYETHEVACDEIERTLDLLRSLHENEPYFRRRIGGVGSFLPINQPLYALTCFSIVPALMADQVFVRPPVAARKVFSEICDTLKLQTHCPNITLSDQDRADFIETCKEGEVEVIIFTGKMENAYRVRKSFSEDVLFIVNGAGHNPIVVAENADLDSAIRSALRVQLYNQGQDCANPSAILVHREVAQSFLEKMRTALKGVIIGDYKDPAVRVGPISNPKDLGRIVGILNKNRPFVDPATPGITHAKTGLVEPTIINRPLKEGGNYTEQLAPIFFLHEYESDDALSLYFENDEYSQNAMYVSLFGNSSYVDDLTSLRFSDGRQLHGKEQIIRNMDLHAKGVERGTQPYGGYGRRASCLIVNGRFMPQPTLPQRDIFEQLVQPTLSGQRDRIGRFDKKATREARVAVERTLILNAKPEQKRKRDIQVLKNRNVDYISQIEDEDRLKMIRKLREVLSVNELEPEQIMEHAYRLSQNGTKNSRATLFRDLYNLFIGQNAGPRISTLIGTIEKDQLLMLLDV